MTRKSGTGSLVSTAPMKFCLDRDWSDPVRTEEYAFEAANPASPYLGIPWAPIINGEQRRLKQHEFNFLNSQTTQWETTCQHAKLDACLDLLLECRAQGLRVFRVFSPHCTEREQQAYRQHGIDLQPCVHAPLVFPEETVPLLDRPQLATFRGFASHPDRDSLLANFPGCELTKAWGVGADSERYRELMATSTFSLCPRGFGAGSIRLSEALSYGSIPVLTGDELRLPPRFERAVVRLPKHLMTPQSLRLVQDQAGECLRETAAPFIAARPADFMNRSTTEACVKAFCYVSDSHIGLYHRMKSTLPENFELHTVWDEQKCNSGAYHKRGWKVAMLARLEAFTQFVERQPMDGQWVYHLDADIEFKTERFTLTEGIPEHVLLVGQAEDKPGKICGGFFCTRALPASVKMLRAVRGCMEQRQLDDQEALNVILREHEIDYGEFAADQVWSPRSIWRSHHRLNLPKTAVVHHANWTIGVKNKIAQLRKGRTK